MREALPFSSEPCHVPGHVPAGKAGCILPAYAHCHRHLLAPRSADTGLSDVHCKRVCSIRTYNRLKICISRMPLSRGVVKGEERRHRCPQPVGRSAGTAAILAIRLPQDKAETKPQLFFRIIHTTSSILTLRYMLACENNQANIGLYSFATGRSNYSKGCCAVP